MLDDAAIAARFGLGLRAGDGEAAPLRQFDRYEVRPPSFAGAPDRAAVAGGLAAWLEEVRTLRADKRMAAGTGDDAALKDAVKASRKYAQETARDEYLQLAGVRATAALTSPAPFVERLVHFWANHFAISVEKLEVIGLGGLLEVEAIRPHVLGRFSDMLLAVEQHPAMLLYLDQAQSIGPDSLAGRAAASRGGKAGAMRKIGLNENLAREIMELHTLGVRSGYAQADVTEFARAMTGWTVAGLARPGIGRFLQATGAPGAFVFAAPMHEPGTRMIMGTTYAQPGEAQARAVLDDLAAHPATAQHLATKLARHFAGDTPPPALVARLAATFTQSGGDLPSVYRVLLAAPEVQGGAAGKFKSPWDWTVSACRAVGLRQIEGRAIAGLMIQLGQPIWRPGSPAGYDDTDAGWAGPDALLRRVEAAQKIAQIADPALDARTLAGHVLPGGGSPATRTAIAQAETRTEALALMLVAPEFMRR